VTRGLTRRPALWLGWGLALLAMAVFGGLGRWQLGRMHEKQAMLDAVQAVLARREARPLALAADPARRTAYDWAAGRGRFADGPAILLDNQSRGRRPGVRAYRLFVPESAQRESALSGSALSGSALSGFALSGSALSESAPPLLVELGWLPLPGDRRMPAVAPVPGERRIAGLLMPPPSGGLGTAAVQVQADGTIVATALDAPALPGLLRQSRLPPRVLRLDPSAPLGYARDLDILPNTLPPQRHLGYAVQWFALAAAVLATALLLSLRHRFRRPRR
jgi:cytochrome oxidase assembly protein ShyY1